MTDNQHPDEEHLFEIVRRRYCAGLTEEELEHVRRGVREGLERADGLAAVPLDPATEPRSVFTPYTPGGDGDE